MDINYIKKPLISIITVSYNAVDTIESTILSVINQQFNDYEYIIIDGGSSDGTLEIIKKYQDKVTCFISEPDKGIYDAMNKGILVANGNWINFMNSGDLFNDYKVLNNIFLKNIDSQTSIIYGNTLAKNSKKIITPPKSINKNFFYGNTICHQSIFFNKNIFEINGLHNLSYKIIADRILLLEAALIKANFMFVDVVISIWDEEGFSKDNVSLYLKESNILRRAYFNYLERAFLRLKLKIASYKTA